MIKFNKTTIKIADWIFGSLAVISIFYYIFYENFRYGDWKKRAIVVNGALIYSVVSVKNNNSNLSYTLNFNNQTIKGNEPCGYYDKYLKGQYFPVYIDTLFPSEKKYILIDKRDFEAFGLEYPDSISKRQQK